MVEIRVRSDRGGFVTFLVDDDDESWIRELPSLRAKGKHEYLVTEYTTSKRPQRKRTEHVARLIVGLLPDESDIVADHINRIPQDNRRENLRIITKAQNQQNLSPQRERKGVPVKSPYRGVTFFRGKWRAYLQWHGKRTYLGLYETQEEAAAAVQRAMPPIIPVRDPRYGGPGDRIQKLHSIRDEKGRLSWVA